jgi:hypothetical protein
MDLKSYEIAIESPGATLARTLVASLVPGPKPRARNSSCPALRTKLAEEQSTSAFTNIPSLDGVSWFDL